ncbi:MAG: response regulator [bacterium]|nr:response regulator [bacterium]
MAQVLIMDDDQVVREIIARVVKLKGHDPLVYPDAGPALQEVDFDAIDLIITDLSMPTPGEEAIRIIRGRGIQTPILVISGHLSHPKSYYLEKMGVQSILSKPFLLHDLIDRIQTLI